MIQRALAEGFLAGFKVAGKNRGVTEISHLLFANEPILFFDANITQLGYLRCVLLYFEAISARNLILVRVNWSQKEM